MKKKIICAHLYIFYKELFDFEQYLQCPQQVPGQTSLALLSGFQEDKTIFLSMIQSFVFQAPVKTKECKESKHNKISHYTFVSFISTVPYMLTNIFTLNAEQTKKAKSYKIMQMFVVNLYCALRKIMWTNNTKNLKRNKACLDDFDINFHKWFFIIIWHKHTKTKTKICFVLLFPLPNAAGFGARKFVSVIALKFFLCLLSVCNQSLPPLSFFYATEE